MCLKYTWCDASVLLIGVCSRCPPPHPTLQRVERAVHDLPHVEVCLNCSARTLRMVADVFFYALKSVLYPLQPLYDR